MAKKLVFNPITSQFDFVLNESNPGISHADLDDLGADDHVQYLLLAGRAGGQSAFGGTASGETLAFRGSTDAGLGFVEMDSPVLFSDPIPSDDTFVAAAKSAMWWRDPGVPNGTDTGNVILSFQRLQAQWDITGGLFVYSALLEQSTFDQQANPVFAAFTNFAAQPIIQTSGLGVGGPWPAISSLIYQASPLYRNNGAGAGVANTGTCVGLQYAPRLSGVSAGDAMDVNTMYAVQCLPQWTGPAGTSANFGTITGLKCNSPQLATFGQNGISRTMTAYYGIDYDAITFAGNVTRVVVNSNLGPQSNAWFLRNLGGAQSEHGSAHMHFDDNFGILLGGTLAGGSDVLLRHLSTVPGALSIYFPNTLDDMQISSPAADRFQMTSNLFPGNEISFGFSRFAFGQTGAVGNQVGVFVAPARTTTINGGWSDFLLTQAGNLTINNTMSEVNAWTINAIALTGGTGSITGYVSTLTVGGMTTSGLGGAETHAFRHTGRRTGRGVDAFEPLSPSQLTADVNDYAPATGNSMRQVWRVDTDASRTITGIAVQQGSDTQWITNVGANNLVLGHQNGASAASNRIISPTGADLTLGPDESACLWHDTTTDRWRILYHTGA